jgi:ribonuclease BN (tRNA processing enzyme)
MSITFNILGTAGRDNALLVQVDSGQSVERLLFDCGAGCLSEAVFADVLALDHLFFSHLHMDHVGGFDAYFRCLYNRDSKANRIWGPPETIGIMQHRFQGFLWNLHEEMSATWLVSDMTSVQSATLAQRAGVRELVLFHLSERYRREDWIEMLREARQVFPNTHYPPRWGLDAAATKAAEPNCGDR